MIHTPSHVVLGGNGVIGRATVAALLARGTTPVSVGRRLAPVDRARTVSADLLVASETSRALHGAEVAYFTVGLPYSSRVWREQWPAILRNTIDAALEHDVHLVYFDNVYAYGLVEGPMSEATPINPTSHKGRIRAAALTMLEDASSRGLKVTVARAADFYGPGASTSVFNTFVLDRIAHDRKGTWLFDADQPHSLTFTRDVGQALALVGTAQHSPGRVWHLPTAPALTGREYIRLATGRDDRVTVMGDATMRLGALFTAAARETREMSYQYTRPYVFDSRAFEEAFGMSATPVLDGIAASREASPRLQ